MNKLQPRTGLTWISFLLLGCWLGCLSIATTAQAAGTNGTNYTEWKTRQQQQDARLQQKVAISPASESDYYLAKPALSVTSAVDKISLNRANVEQLQQLHGIGQKKAQAIVEYRQKNGKFKTIEDIQLVKGIGPALFAKNKARLGL